MSALREGLLLGGRYRLLAPLGEGATGSVWRARNEAIDREFALKLLAPAAQLDPLAVQRFLQEARAAGRLRHRGIVETYDVGSIASDELPREMQGAPYLVMELLTGETLAGRLEQAGGKLPAEELVPIVREAALALECAHRAGIVHRDVKPGNIFLHHDGEARLVKLVDFGISKLLDPALDAGLTRTGTVLGSPAYMSPEQARGDREVDASTDVWALGVVLYQGISGRHPFQGPNRNALLRSISRDDPPPLATAPGLAQVVDRCLKKERGERPASAAVLARMLDDLVRPEGKAPARVGLRTVAALMVGLAAASAVTWALTRRGSPSVTRASSPPALEGRTTVVSSTPETSAVAPPASTQEIGSTPKPSAPANPHPSKPLPDRPRDPGF